MVLRQAHECAVLRSIAYYGLPASPSHHIYSYPQVVFFTCVFFFKFVDTSIIPSYYRGSF